MLRVCLPLSSSLTAASRIAAWTCTSARRCKHDVARGVLAAKLHGVVQRFAQERGDSRAGTSARLALEEQLVSVVEAAVEQTAGQKPVNLRREIRMLVESVDDATLVGSNVFKRAAVSEARNKRYRMAIGLVEDMREAGHALDSVAYQLLLHCYSQRGRVDVVRDLIREMKSVNIGAGLVAMNALLRAMNVSGDPQRHTLREGWILGKVPEKPNRATWGLFVASCDTLSDMDYVLGQAKRSAVKFDPWRILTAKLRVCERDAKWGLKRAKDEIAAFDGKLLPAHYHLWFRLTRKWGRWQHIELAWDVFESRAPCRNSLPSPEMLAIFSRAMFAAVKEKMEAAYARRAVAAIAKYRRVLAGGSKKLCFVATSAAFHGLVKARVDTVEVKEFVRLLQLHKLITPELHAEYAAHTTRERRMSESQPCEKAANFFKMPLHVPK
eukprot:Rhum_TRINITY_DN3050_c0_g2::Rhum_TRINITY_DN3050_c0_g2_i1::g.9358::m.9358